MQTTDSEYVSDSEDGVREVKIYQPLPYHQNTIENKDISNAYKSDNQFFNIIESRYENDTFYVKIQENLSAREQFFALGDIVSKNIKTGDTQNKTNLPTEKFNEDLSKYYAIVEAPAIVRTYFSSFISNSLFNFHIAFSYSSPFLNIPSPPPNC